MTTCREYFLHFPDRFGGGGVNPSGQPDRFFPVFFYPFPYWLSDSLTLSLLIRNTRVRCRSEELSLPLALFNWKIKLDFVQSVVPLVRCSTSVICTISGTLHSSAVSQSCFWTGVALNHWHWKAFIHSGWQTVMPVNAAPAFLFTRPS